MSDRLPGVTIDVLLTIATNLVSNALWDVMTDPAQQEEVARGARTEAAADLATAQLAKVLRSVRNDDAAQSAVAAFFRSVEVRHLVAQLYRTNLYEVHPHLVDLRQ